MGNLKGTKTHENLKHAFAGESQANRRYLYFARAATPRASTGIPGGTTTSAAWAADG